MPWHSFGGPPRKWKLPHFLMENMMRCPASWRFVFLHIAKNLPYRKPMVSSWYVLYLHAFSEDDV